MTDFPLCKAARLKVLSFIDGQNGYANAPTLAIRASEVEALLASAPVVYGMRCDDLNWIGTAGPQKGHEASARLLLIEPIKIEPEEIRHLRELVGWLQDVEDSSKLRFLVDNAKSFLRRLDGVK